LFGKQILGLFGSDYIAGYDSLLVLSIAWLIRVYIGPSDIILLMTGQVKASRRNLYIAAITSVVSACIFIPFLGVVGAILSMSVSGVLLSLLNHYVVVKLYGISYMGRKGLNDRIITLKGKLLLILKNHSKNTKTEINDG
jgi:O-antigen/teichoic acid export membrane protein